MPFFFTFSWSTKEDDLSRGLTALQHGFDAYGCSQAADSNQVVTATLSQTVKYYVYCLFFTALSSITYPGRPSYSAQTPILLPGPLLYSAVKAVFIP